MSLIETEGRSGRCLASEACCIKRFTRRHGVVAEQPHDQSQSRAVRPYTDAKRLGARDGGKTETGVLIATHNPSACELLQRPPV